MEQSEDTLEGDRITAVITSFSLNQDKNQCPNLDENDVFRILCDICDGERRHEMIPEQDKYCNVDVLYLDSKEGHIAENSRVISDKVLLIDTYGIYLFSYQDDAITEITDLADIKCDSDIQRIRGRILSALQQ